ncbi:MAG: isochorismatase family protein [Nanoarchaeota archaeon]
MKIIGVNTDTLYDFMRDDDSFKGALSVPGARAIEPNLERLTELFERRGIQVINLADQHTEQSEEISTTPDYKTTYNMHCKRGTKGTQFVPASDPKDPYILDYTDAGFDPERVRSTRNIVLYKDHFDAFHGPPQSPHAEGVVQAISPDAAIIYGVATDVCVDYAVIGFARRVGHVYVVDDAIKELPYRPLEETLDRWDRIENVSRIKTADVERIIEESEVYTR